MGDTHFGNSTKPQHGGHIDDTAMFGFEHGGEEGSGDPEGCHHVYIDDSLNLLITKLANPLAPIPYACIVDNDGGDEMLNFNKRFRKAKLQGIVTPFGSALFEGFECWPEEKCRT